MLGVVTIVFILLHASGDPATLLVSQDATQADIAEIRRAYGLDQPLSVQYARFVSRAARGDLGYSYRQGLPVGELIVERLRATCELALAGLAVAVLLGVPLGIFAAARHGSALDTAAMTLALLGTSVPSFWLGLLLIIVFGVQLGWLPVSGSGTLKHLLMPAFVLGGFYAARSADSPGRACSRCWPRTSFGRRGPRGSPCVPFSSSTCCGTRRCR
jgi:peptide/nickel transport system permease protein